jgi:PTS system mannose-specific IIA component
MIGVVVVTHLQLAKELVSAAEMITGSKLVNFRTVSIDPSDDPDHAGEKVLSAVKGADSGGGVVLLVDMFGGMPSNLSLSLLERGKTEIVTGVNLPMIIEAATSSQQVSLEKLVSLLTSSGQSGIRAAGEILDKKVVEGKES